MACFTDSWEGIADCLLGAVVLKFLLDVVGWLLHTRPGVSPASIKAKGKWALVTGSSDGIGEAYAYEAARLGFNLILVSRTQAKLESVAACINTRYPNSEIIIQAFDFAAKDPNWGTLVELTGRYPIGLLVNNVGINVDCPTYFLDHSESKIDDIIQVNIVTLNRMCYMVLPGMIERRGGAIVNLSSFTARVPAPLLAVYSATKSYADSFSLCLNGEYADKAIYVQSVTPGFVASSMSGMRAGGMVATPEIVARQSLSRIGQIRTAPFWVHALIEKVMTTLPYALVSKIILNANKKTRSRWLQRQERNRSK